MNVTLVNHASIFIEDNDIGFLTDPWFFGEVFNESWGLEFETPKSTIDKVLEKTTHIYISHEHPDHLHFPTLKNIVNKFKNNINLYIQDLPRKEVRDVLTKIGFKNIIEVKHREFIELNSFSRIYLYSVFPVDSACCYIKNENSKTTTILNLNDTDLCKYDLKKIKKDLPKINILFNQFSFATYNGNPDYINETRRNRDELINSYIYEQEFFKPNISIPFASFSYFCTPDNKILNKYKTNLVELRKKLLEKKLQSKILLPGQLIDVNNIERFNETKLELIEKLKKPFKEVNQPKTSIEDLFTSFYKCHDHLRSRYPKFLINFLGDFNVYCFDINQRINFNFRNKKITKINKNIKEDLKTYSQPLFYAFANSWGMNSLTIGGRLILYKKQKKFMFLRVLLALANSNMNFRFNKSSKTTYSYLFINFERCFFQILARLQSAIFYTEEFNSSLKKTINKT